MIVVLLQSDDRCIGAKDGNQTKSRVFEVSLIDVNHPPEEILFEGELLVR